ncbi:MAG: hypothetical protein WCD18_07745 [Thermosynechococcaceae cyanobacterium]
MTKTSSIRTSFSPWLRLGLLPGRSSFWAEAAAELGHLSVRCHPFNVGKVWVPVAVGLGAIALWRWNSALLLALLMGGGSSWVLYRGWARPKQGSQDRLQRWLQNPNTPLVLSVGGGLAMLVFSYSALAVWQDWRSPWLALMLLSQEVGILLVLGLALGLILKRSTVAPTHSFDRCVAGLLHRDALRRLIAVRQLSKLTVQGILSAQEQSQAAEYLHLLRRKEKDPMVRKAIQESLTVLAPSQCPQLGDRSSASDRLLQTPVRTSLRQPVPDARVCS